MKKIFASLLCFVLAFGAPIPSFAAYARLAPPLGWSPGGAAASTAAGTSIAGSFRYGGAAAATTVLLGRINANAALTVAGSSYAVPVGMKLAGNAAVKAAEFSFGNPYLFAAALALPFAYQWYLDSDLKVIGGVWNKKKTQTGCENGVCFEFSDDGVIWGTAAQACAAGFAKRPGNEYRVNTGVRYVEPLMCQYDSSLFGGPPEVFTFPIIKRVLPGTQNEVWVPVTLPEFIAQPKVPALPVPVIKELPIDWPVEDPVINPDPADKTKPTPIWLPTGEPVKNPSVTGQPDSWTQPGVKVTPSPAIGDPWRVDITPDPITKGDPSPNTGYPGAPAPGTSSPTPDKIEIETCGLPGKPKCQIDELDTKRDKGTTFEQPRDDLEQRKSDSVTEIEKAATIQAPRWTFSFALPTGCAPFPTGIRGIIIDMCQYQSTIHNLLSMIWAGTTVFTLIGMVGRTIRES